MDVQLHAFGGRLPAGIANRQRVGGGLGGREIHAARVGGPHLALGRVERDSFRVGDVVAKLRFFAAMNQPRRKVKRTDSKIRSAQLLDGASIVRALLFGFLRRIAAFEIAVGLIAREQNETDVDGHACQNSPGIKEGVFPG